MAWGAHSVVYGTRKTRGERQGNSEHKVAPVTVTYNPNTALHVRITAFVTGSRK